MSPGLTLAPPAGFFLVTGFGDFCGVWAGHFSYYLAKKYTLDDTLKMGEQAHVRLLASLCVFLCSPARRLPAAAARKTDPHACTPGRCALVV